MEYAFPTRVGVERTMYHCRGGFETRPYAVVTGGGQPNGTTE
jgi:hypothetical protein